MTLSEKVFEETQSASLPGGPLSFFCLTAALNNVGAQLHRLGQHNRAMHYYREALQLHIKSPPLTSIADVCTPVDCHREDVLVKRYEVVRRDEECLRRIIDASSGQNGCPSPTLDIYPSLEVSR